SRGQAVSVRRHRAAFFPLARLRGRVGEGPPAASPCPGVGPLPDPPPQAGEGTPAPSDGPSGIALPNQPFAITVLMVTLAGLILTVPVHAQPIESFYRGRTVTVVVGYSVGGGYDAHARVLARHLGKHIPGNPSVVVQNMPGGGSLRAANYLYNAAPKDGATLGVFARGMAMEPLIGTSGTNFDARKFAWIGSGTNEVSVCATWHASKVKTWSDALVTPFTVAGEGSGSDPDIFSIMLRNVLGAKMRLVSGYPGGADMTLAIERGEVDGRCGWTWSSVKLQRPDWVADHKLNVLIQLATQPSPELPGVP